jgi:hypothetical protein
MKFKKIKIASTLFISLSPLPTLAITDPLIDTDFAVTDGWATSSANSRSAALQLGYSGLYDPYNIWVNPALINNYRNQAYIELGTVHPNESTAEANDAITPSSQMGGANIATRIGVFGIYIGRQYRDGLNNKGIGVMGDAVNGLPFGFDTPPISNPNNKLDLFYGGAVGPMLLGARLNYSSVANSNNQFNPDFNVDTAISQDASEINLSLGMGFKNLPIDFALTIGKPTLDASDTDNTTSTKQSIKSDGGLNFGFAARGMFLRSRNSYLLTYLSYASDNNSSKYQHNLASPVNATRDQKETSYALSGAFHYMPNSSSMVVTQIGFAHGSNKRTMSVSEIAGNSTIVTSKEVNKTGTTIPLTIAFETKAFTNFRFRGSAFKLVSAPKKTTAINKQTGAKVSKTTTKTEEDTSAVTLALGLRYDLMSNLYVDAVVNQDVLFSGTYLLSGVADTLSSQISMGYEF